MSWGRRSSTSWHWSPTVSNITSRTHTTTATAAVGQFWYIGNLTLWMVQKLKTYEFWVLYFSSRIDLNWWKQTLNLSIFMELFSRCMLCPFAKLLKLKLRVISKQYCKQFLPLRIKKAICSYSTWLCYIFRPFGKPSLHFHFPERIIWLLVLLVLTYCQLAYARGE